MADSPGGPPPRYGSPPDDQEPGPATVPSLLSDALQACAAQGVSGLMRVTGEPGGVIHLAGGGIVAVDTAGAPGPEVLLVSSGRIAEAAWKDVFATAAADGRMADELVRRGLIGGGELDALLRLALADGLFVLASGEVEACQPEPAAALSLLPLDQPAEPGWLLAESVRRLRVLASAPGRVDHDRDRVARGHQAPPGTSLPGVQEGILALANDRRTARDMAFALGTGVYALTLEFIRMRDAGLLTVSSRRGSGKARNGWPEGGPYAGRTAAAAGPGDDTESIPVLPRRRKGQSGGHRRSQPPGGTPGNAGALLRLLRPGHAADRDADG